MGNCRSCDSRSTLTAKLILQSGDLQEFSWPIRVSLLLQKDSNSFICSSDDMEFDEYAAPMGGDDVLRPGEIYFELPLAWRHVRLQAEDMAALALKATVALARASGGGDDDGGFICCGCSPRKRAPPPAVICEKEMPLLAGGGGVRMGRRGGGGKERKFVAKLTAIVED